MPQAEELTDGGVIPVVELIIGGILVEEAALHGGSKGITDGGGTESESESETVDDYAK